MGESRNLIVAVILTVLVLVGWQIVFPAHPPQNTTTSTSSTLVAGKPTTAAKGSAAQSVAENNGDMGVASLPESARANSVDAPALSASGSQHIADTSSVTHRGALVDIRSKRVHGAIQLEGARLDALKLLDYRVGLKKTDPFVTLLSPLGTSQPYVAQFGWLSSTSSIALPGPKTPWVQEAGEQGKNALMPGSPVHLMWNNGQGVTFYRKISIDNDYMFTIEDSVKNDSGHDIQLYPYASVLRRVPAKKESSILHQGFIGEFQKDGLEELSYKKVRKEHERVYRAQEGWIGITDKYWATALIPPQTQIVDARFKIYQAADGKEMGETNYVTSSPVLIAAGVQGSFTHRLFAGAKVVSIINHYRKAGVYRFDLLVDWGWFYFLAKPMFYVLDYIGQMVHNFGVAIIIVTILIKLLFFPIANRSYVATGRMRMIQPQVQRIRELHKDDRVKTQQEIMALYKREKVSLFSGCLPTLIQVPVFFALYKVLYGTIEMRHAPFFGWIRDLSAPDPTSIFNLFGLIHWTPPQILMIGVWPILMGITMYLQQRLMPVDKAQQKIFMFLPIIFTVMFAHFPAGLVIYWAWNNLLSTGQQMYIMRRHNIPIALFSRPSKHTN